MSRPQNARLEVSQHDWVDTIVDSSAGLTQHCYLRNAVDFAPLLHELVSGMFRAFDPTDPPLLRTYADGGQRFGLVQQFVNNKPNPSDDLERYVATRLGRPDFCLTLNGLTKWSEPFTALAQTSILQPLLRKTGCPFSGCDFYSFIGNYGFTPFGVHDDNDHSLLIHTGPSAKKVWVWPRADYVKLKGDTFTSVDFASLLAAGRDYTLFPGDVVFIPKGDFHIFETTGFSITVGLTIFPLNSAEDAKLALDFMIPEEDEDLYFAVNDDYASYSAVPRRITSLRHLISARRAALLSNGSITTLPRCKAVTSERLNEDLICRAPHYHPLCLDGDRPQTLFVRGRPLPFSIKRGLADLAAFVNAHEFFTVGELTNAMAEQWTEDVARIVLGELIELGGVEVDVPIED